MILIKRLELSHKGYTIQDGLKSEFDNNGKLFVFRNDFWGNAEVYDENIDLIGSKYVEDNKLVAIESIDSRKLCDGFVTLTMKFDKTNEETNQILLFMEPFPVVKEHPSTTGKILFKRYPSEAIILLKENDFVSFTNGTKQYRLKLINGTLINIDEKLNT